MPSWTPNPKPEGLAFAAKVKEAIPDPGWPADRRAAIDGDGDPDVNFINRHFVGKRWRDITDDELDFTGQDSWAFDDAALAYFFPAFLVANLEDRTDDWLNNAEYWIPRLSPLKQWGYEKQHVQLLLEICTWMSKDWWEEDVAQWRERVILPLEQELSTWI